MNSVIYTFLSPLRTEYGFRVNTTVDHFLSTGLAGSGGGNRRNRRMSCDFFIYKVRLKASCLPHGVLYGSKEATHESDL